MRFESIKQAFDFAYLTQGPEFGRRRLEQISTKVYQKEYKQEEETSCDPRKEVLHPISARTVAKQKGHADRKR